MTESPNPYQPPTPIGEKESWWGQLQKLFRFGPRVVSFVESANFAKGDAIIFGGISFFVDPSDRKTFYAASPSIDRSDVRMDLITNEVIRVLPLFLDEFPNLRRRLRGRRLVVRMIESYAKKQSAFVRETVVPTDLVGGELDRM